MFVGEQRVYSGRGKHKKLVGFAFRFSGALDPGAAQSTGNDLVAQAIGKKRKTLSVVSASYDPGNDGVTISVAGFKSNKPAEATITGLERFAVGSRAWPRLRGPLIRPSGTFSPAGRRGR